MTLLLDPSGRIDRGAFWKGLGIVLVLFVLFIGFAYVPGIEAVPILAFIPIIALIWPLVVLPIKRLRDGAVSPWWLLTIIIPMIGPLPGLVLFIICGVKAGVVRSKYAGVERIA